MNIAVHPKQLEIQSSLKPHSLYERLKYTTGELPVKLPLVSVVITNHNYIDYVFQAIESVVQQTYGRIECVVIDDCSPDGSYSKIIDYLDKLADDRFRVLKTPSNMGQLGACKVGFENTSGEFVVFLDADDMLFPEFVDRHVAAHLNTSMSAGLTASDTCQINAENDVLEGTLWLLRKPRVAFHKYNSNFHNVFPFRSNSEDLADVPNLLYFPAGHIDYAVNVMSSLMFRRQLLQIVFPRETSRSRICADTYLVFFCNALSGTVILTDTLTFYRLHGKNNFNKGWCLGADYTPSQDINYSKINEDLRALILAHLLENRSLFTNIPAKRVDSIIRQLTMKKTIWRLGRSNHAMRIALGYEARWRFLLRYHPFYRRLRLYKVLSLRGE